MSVKIKQPQIRSATGTVVLSATSTAYTVTGIPFTPKYVAVYYQDYTGRMRWATTGSVVGQSGIVMGASNDNTWCELQSNSGQFVGSASITMSAGQFTVTSPTSWGSTTSPTANWVAIG